MSGSLSDKIVQGLVVGLVPTVSMTLATLLLTKVEVSAQVEASLQNFAAGLIIAAVAGELFPIMMNSSDNASFIGITAGFVIGLAVIYGLEHVAEKLEHIDDEKKRPPSNNHSRLQHSHDHDHNDSINNPLIPHDDMALIEHGELQYEADAIERASHILVSKPEHRSHIVGHLNELLDSIQQMEEKSDQLTSNPDLTVRQKEDIAEFIDEKVHMLQYKLDHCRRLLEGSEVTEHLSFQPSLSQWVTEERKAQIRKGVAGLRFTAEYLLEHIHEQAIDTKTLHEMRIHMDYMDKQIHYFHEHIENAASKWRRRQLLETQEGDYLPMGLVLPVLMDCWVDGFLIGISVAINLQAGIILGFANCLEMGFLGMAYATRLVKCTGSSWTARTVALYGPPLVMLFAAGIGAMIGEVTRSLPALFIGMVAFGSVALLFLVCNELLIEAKETQGEEERWWISIMVFVGVYLVLMIDHVILKI
jgi:zinc transporter ZupT